MSLPARRQRGLLARLALPPRGPAHGRPCPATPLRRGFLSRPPRDDSPSRGLSLTHQTQGRPASGRRGLFTAKGQRWASAAGSRFDARFPRSAAFVQRVSGATGREIAPRRRAHQRRAAESAQGFLAL